MNIVHVVRQFYPAAGGFESVVLELASAQVSAGHRVRVVTLNRLFNTTSDRILPSRDVVAGAEVIRLSYRGSPRYPLAPSAIRFIRDADIVHVHAVDFFFDYLAWTKPLHRKKLVVSTHGGFFHTSYAARLKQLYFSTVTRASLAWYDGVVAVSAADHELFSRIQKGGVVCIENGVNIAKYLDSSSTAPTKVILALGRLSTNKGLDRLLEFLAALHRHDPQWKVIIAGRQWDVGADELTALAGRLHLLGAVEIFVDPDEEKIRQLMTRCSVFASASSYEGFGLAAIEGMSAGLFPLLNDIPNFRDLVARTHIGMLVDFSDPQSAAEAFVKKWQETETDYPHNRASAIEAASAYDWPQVCKAYQDLYDQIRGTTKRTILGVPVSVTTVSQAVELLDAQFERVSATLITFANAHTLNVASRDEKFRAVLQKSVVLNDGIGMDIASLILFGFAFPQNLNGTDFVPHYLQHTRHRYRIFLLGSKPGIAEQAGRYFSRRFPQHQIVGCCQGYFTKDEAANVAAMISASRADIVLVGMGNPQQELWLAGNLEATGTRLGFAVGALFDFAAGHARRAPAWARTLRIEWCYRLAHEPMRLARRYLVGNPLFILRILGQRISRAPKWPALNH